MTGQPDSAAELGELWGRRAALTSREWAKLYWHVNHCLAGKCTELLEDLPGSAAEYIQDFFLDKVFHGNPIGELHHSGALIEYYRRYLLDRLKLAEHKHRAMPAESPDESDEAAKDLITTAADHYSYQVFDEQERGNRASDEWFWRLPAAVTAIQAGTEPNLANDSGFRHYVGLDLPSLVDAARDFLAARDPWQALATEMWWIALYLGEHHCPGSDAATPLSTVAKRHGIPSHHHKAVRLGTTVPKNANKGLDAFRYSYLGQWLSHNGIAISQDNQTAIWLALKVLCCVALIHKDG